MQVVNLVAATLACGILMHPHAAAAGDIEPRYEVVAEGLKGPRGLAIGPSGELYAVEQSGGTVIRIDARGRITRLAEGLSSPHDVALDRAGNLYVAESGANRIAKVAPNGVVTTHLADVAFPVDLDFSPSGELLVCEFYAGRVLAFDGHARRVVATGLKGPHGLAFGPAGEVYVNELHAGRVVRLGAGGTEPFAVLDRAVGIAFGSTFELFGAERPAGKLVRVDRDGRRMVLLEGLDGPRDPALDSSGALYVAETGAGRILKLTSTQVSRQGSRAASR